MAIRGETLGDAFVRVHADTSLMKGELERAFSKMGADDGDAWGKAFFKRIQQQIRSRADKSFEVGFVTGNFDPFIKQFASIDDAMEDAQERLRRLGDEGQLSAKKLDKLREVLNVAFDTDGLRKMQKALDDQNKAWLTYGKNVDATLGRQARAMAEQDKAWTSYGRNVEVALTREQRLLAEQDKAWDSYAKNRLATMSREAKGFASITQVWDEISQKQRRIIHDASTGMFRISGEDHEALSFLQRFRRDTENLGNTIGRLFGRGSRNDFLNFFGSVVKNGIDVTSAAIGGLVGVIGDIPRAFRAVQDSFGNVLAGFSQFSNAIADAQGVGAKFGAGFGQVLGGLEAAAGPLGLALSAVVTVAVAATAVFGGLTFALGALGEALAVVTAAASLLAGGVLAVAGAVETALIGALVVAAPLIVGLAAGIGTVVVALANMTDAQKNAFKPLQEQFKAIGTAVSQTFLRDIPIWVKTASNLLTTFAGPTMQKVAGGIRDAVTEIAKDFEKPEIKRALDAWSDALGPIAGNLTTAFGKALEGALAFFAPILPLAVKLSESIERVATQFTTWAASASGQNQIANFFNTAWQQAETLWQIVVNLGGALQTVFNAGNQVGSEFLDFLESKTRQLQEFLNSAQGQNQLAEWFRAAKEFGDNLWTTVEKIFGALAKLNTPQAQEFANKLVIAFGRLADVIGALSPLFDGVGRAIAGMLGFASKAAGTLLEVVAQVIGGFSGLFRALGHVPGMGWATDLADDLDAISASAEAAGKMLVELPDQIDVDFNADTTDMILAAQEAAGIVDAQDGSTATTLFGGDTGPLKTAVGDASTILGGAPKDATTTFKGDLSALIADAAGADALIANFNQGAVATVTFDGDTLPLVDDVNRANVIIGGVKPTYETEFGGDTGALMEATISGNTTIEQVHPEWMTHFGGESTLLDQVSELAKQQVLAVPIDWTTFFNGDVGQLTLDAALANDELIKVPTDWNTVFQGETGALLDSTVVANEVIAKVYPNWETAFAGDTSALFDSTVSANAYINGVHDENITMFGGDTGALLDSTIQSNGYIGNVQDLNLTTFTGDNNPLSQAAKNGTLFIAGVPDGNLTTFLGNPKPVQDDAAAATRAINGVPTSKTTTFYINVIGEGKLADLERRAAAMASGGLVGMAGGGIAGAMAGTILKGPQIILAGEAGPEAIVPLNRRLSQVDPSVRALSAIAQGKAGGFGGTIEAGAIVVNSNLSNPELVAESVMDRLVLTLNG